jgi:hypothetical protein
MSRHPQRQGLARFDGATDIVEERGEKGVARIKEQTWHAQRAQASPSSPARAPHGIRILWVRP